MDVKFRPMVISEDTKFLFKILSDILFMGMIFLLLVSLKVEVVYQCSPNMTGFNFNYTALPENGLDYNYLNYNHTWNISADQKTTTTCYSDAGQKNSS